MTAIMQDSKRRLPLRQMTDSGSSLLGPTVEYALRAMAQIASSPEARPVTASELSAATFVPVHYLSKVLRKLVTAGLLVSQKGHRGGFVLARSAREIRFMDVLEAVGRAPNSQHCAFGWGRCDARHPCPLHPAWDKLGRLFADWTQQTTLADVKPASARLRRGQRPRR